MIFFSILSLLIIPHYRSQFSALKSANIWERNFTKTPTAQPLRTPYTVQFLSIRAANTSSHYSVNVPIIDFPPNMALGHLDNSPTISPSIYYRNQSILCQTSYNKVTISSLPNHIIPSNIDHPATRIPRKFHFMLHLPTNNETIKSHPSKPTTTNNHYNTTINTYLDLTLSISTVLKPKITELQQPPTQLFSCINHNKSSIIPNQIAHNLVNTSTTHSQNFSQRQVYITSPHTEETHPLSQDTSILHLHISPLSPHQTLYKSTSSLTTHINNLTLGKVISTLTIRKIIHYLSHKHKITQSPTLHPNIPPQPIQNLITATLYSPLDQTFFLTSLPKTTTLNNQSTNNVLYILAEPYTVSTTCYLIFFFNINYVNNFCISICMLFSPHLFAHTVKNAKLVNLRPIDNPANSSISRGTTTSQQVPPPTARPVTQMITTTSTDAKCLSMNSFSPPTTPRDSLSSQTTNEDNTYDNSSYDSPIYEPHHPNLIFSTSVPPMTVLLPEHARIRSLRTIT